MVPLIHSCSDSIVILDHVNFNTEYIRRDHITGFLRSQYRRLSNNMPLGSEWLCGNNITERVTAITTKKKL